MITPEFRERVLLVEVRLLFETYLDYILKSSDKDMAEMEKRLTRLEGMLHLEGKLPLVYRPIVERCMDDEGKTEIEKILQRLCELRRAVGRRPPGSHACPLQAKKGKTQCPANA